MKKNLDLMLVDLGLKNINLSLRQKEVFKEWRSFNDGDEKDFYRHILKLSISHENQYRLRKNCEKKGHNEEILSIAEDLLYTRCKNCGGFYTRCVNDPKYIESPSLTAKYF